MSKIPPGPVAHLIQVSCDPTQLTLSVTRPRIALNPGDTVVWSFLGIPAGWTPWIEFRHAANEAFIGPLESLTQTPGGIWGVCRADASWEGSAEIPFEYRAVIQKGFAAGWDDAGSVVWSAPASLAVLPGGIGQELTYDVTLAAPDSPALVVTPLLQTLTPGDSLVWRFPSDLPGGVNAWRPRIKFHRYEGTGTVSNQHLGPFASLSTLPGVIRGTGNSGVDGLYFFEVALVSVATGQIGWLSSGDPVVDNRGGVIGPPE